MPGRDGSGPMGYGVRTGRGLGFCNRSNPSNSGFRGFRSRGRGFGFFCRRNFGRFLSRFNQNATTREDLEYERDALKQEIENIDREIQSIDHSNGNT